jgi:hypothetical protein
MVRPSDTVAKTLATRARRIVRFLDKIERMNADGRLSNLDVELAYSGGYLEFHALVENSIEELFLGLLSGRLRSSDRSVNSLVVVKSDRTARSIVHGAGRYLDWLPYSRYTVPRAQAYFSSGRPFTRLSKSDLQAFEHSAYIRNALAHQSRAAQRTFEANLISGKNLLPQEHKPARYLRGTHTRNQTRMSYMLAWLVSVMVTLSK